MIAALPMYDFGDLGAANDGLWALIRDRMRAQGLPAPDGLTHDAPDLWAQWLSPGLVLSQTCGSPYRNRLHGQVTLIGTPDYALPGCQPGYYRSVFVVRADDPRATLRAFDGAQMAYNDALSQSGWAAPQIHAGALGIRLLAGPQTGGHRRSAQVVADGRADIAALDGVTWRHMLRLDPVAARLRVIDQTAPTPGLPLIAAKGCDRAALFDAVSAAIAALPEQHRATLGLRGLVYIPPETYLGVPNPPPPPGADQAICAKPLPNPAG